MKRSVRTLSGQLNQALNGIDPHPVKLTAAQKLRLADLHRAIVGARMAQEGIDIARRALAPHQTAPEIVRLNAANDYITTVVDSVYKFWTGLAKVENS